MGCVLVPLVRITSRIAPIALSVAARAFLFLVLSWYVYAFAESKDAAGFFQDLFFQSILITFLSASSYFAVVSKGWDPAKDSLLVFTHLLMAIITFVSLILLYWLYDLGLRGEVFFALLAGALATGLGSPLTGIVVRRHGGWWAYGPSILFASVTPAIVLVPWLDPVLACVLAIVVFQVCVFLVTAFVARHDILLAFQLRSLELSSTTVGAWWGTFLFGVLNSATVGYVYWFRELWILVQPAEIAATILFLYRVFDTALGIAVIDVGSRFDVTSFVDRYSKRLISPIILLGGIVLFSLHELESRSLSPLTLAVLGQVALECVRFPMIIFFLYQSATRSSMGYLMYVLGTIGLSHVVLFFIPLQVFQVGLFVFLALTNLFSALITCVYASRRRN